MFRKVSLKTILIVFAVLLILVVVVKLIDHKKGNRSFKSELVSITPDQINKIDIYPRVMNGARIELTKVGARWAGNSEGTKFNADGSFAEAIVNELNHLKPESVASNKKDRWNHYQVTDSLGTHVQLFAGNSLKADLYLGKFSFSSQRHPKSYVRLADDKTTYGVSGYIASSFNRDVNGFKDKTVISSKKGDWTKLTFSYPADSSFVLEKENSKWTIPSAIADSAKVVKFLSALQNINQYKYAKQEPQGQPTFALKIDDSKGPIEIKGYQESNDLVISSSQNPGTYFEGKNIKKKLFPSRSSLSSSN
ncbi:MAG TPA: DUF4340 domain-containing protein [Sunxiuqinia sp.]|nr:DUF4340 domain-containing protein [Sunxiuqinia sp.]